MAVEQGPSLAAQEVLPPQERSAWPYPVLDAPDRIVAAVIISSGAKAMHVRAALRNGLSPDEIKELLLQTAIYCGVPDANTAFRIARRR